MADIFCGEFPINVGISEKHTDQVQIYPNPNNGTFTLVSNAEAGPIQLRLIDVTGRTIHYSEPELEAGSELMIDVQGLASAGVYKLLINNGRHSGSINVVIQ